MRYTCGMAMGVTSLGVEVAQLRKRQGLTQAELAKRAQVSRKWLVEFERGKPEAQLWKVLDVLSVLGSGLVLDDRSGLNLKPNSDGRHS